MPSLGGGEEVSAKWLKSLPLNTLLGALKVFTGEVNKNIVVSMNELQTQEEAKQHGKALSLRQWKRA